MGSARDKILNSGAAASPASSVVRLVVHGALGRMGALICALARDDSRFELAAEIDQRTGGVAAGGAKDPVHVVVDFSSDQGAAAAAGLASAHGAALLVGTTGLSRQTLSAIEVVSRTVPVMIAANTSAGVAVLSHLAAEAARLLGDRYTVDLIEVHHVAKRDAPSGTALRIAESMRRRGGAELPPERIHSIRAGDVVGDHTVELAGPGERIRLSHFATTRDLFARGALDAAAWLRGRPPGRYTIEQALGIEDAE